MELDAAGEPNDLIAWQISPERQRHEWMRMRRAIVGTRWRIALYGHAAFLLACAGLDVAGVQCASFISLGWWSLLFISVAMLLMEWAHVKLLPKTPPRFVVRRNGLTEYDEHGPCMHWDWDRAALLSIENDRERPGYRSLVVGMKADAAIFRRWLRFSIPLPASTTDDADSDERAIVAALCDALEANSIGWQSKPGGAIALLPKTR